MFGFKKLKLKSTEWKKDLGASMTVKKQALTQHRQKRYLPGNLLLEETSSMPLVLWSIGVISTIIILLVIWASIAQVKETAVTFGEIVPSGQVQMIQHLEGGIVEKILVQDGQMVKKGQVLIELSATQAYADLQQTRSHELALLLDIARLQAFINHQTPDLGKWKAVIMQSKYYNGDNQKEIDQLLQEEEQHLSLQQATLVDQTRILQDQLSQKKNEVGKIEQQKQQATTQLELLNKEKKMYDDLGKDMPISQRDYLAILRQINETQGALNQIPDLLQQAQSAAAETQNRLNELTSNANQAAAKELSDVQSELSQVKHATERAEDRVNRLEVTAHVDGIIQGLDLKPGSVIQPGGKIMELVPTGDNLVVKTRISTRDIGYIKIGDKVSVRVNTYDYSRYGDIDGLVKTVSPTTFLDENKQPYYEGIVSLSKNYVGNDPNKYKLQPGMTVQANIVTGEKSVMSYLLKPIKTTLSSSFKER